MLAELRIKNFAILDDLTVQFAPGFNVITGETGAGKSLIIEALGLLLGNKFDRQYLNGGETVISALIYPEPDAELIISRRISADGYSKVTLNGELATVTQLANQVKPLMAVHSQNDTHLITKSEEQLRVVDCYAGQEHLALLKQYSQLYQKWQRVKAELNELRAVDGQADNLKELYSYQLQELKNAQLQPGEDEALNQELKRWQSQALITEVVSNCRQVLEENILPGLSSVAKELSKMAAFSSLDNEIKQAEQLQDIASDLSFSLSQHLHTLDFSPETFTQKQERLYFLNDLKRKYKLSLSELIAYEQKLADEIQKINRLEEELKSKLPVERELAAKLTKLAQKLSANRCQAAKKICQETEKVLATLAMPKVRLAIEVESLADSQLTATGADKVNFVVTFNPGQPFKALSKVASGGELSRLMLALKTVVGQADKTPVLIFDEIDTGVGGQTAVNIGACLARLAKESQVIVITHLPQIAAFTQHHIVIEKTFANGQVSVKARYLEKEAERLEELTKLSGLLSNSKLDVEHARLLIKQAQNYNSGRTVS